MIPVARRATAIMKEMDCILERKTTFQKNGLEQRLGPLAVMEEAVTRVGSNKSRRKLPTCLIEMLKGLLNAYHEQTPWWMIKLRCSL